MTRTIRQLDGVRTIGRGSKNSALAEALRQRGALMLKHYNSRAGVSVYAVTDFGQKEFGS